MNNKIYVGFTSDQLNLIQEMLKWELEKDKRDNFEDNEDYHELLKETINTILKEV